MGSIPRQSSSRCAIIIIIRSNLPDTFFFSSFAIHFYVDDEISYIIDYFVSQRFLSFYTTLLMPAVVSIALKRLREGRITRILITLFLV